MFSWFQGGDGVDASHWWAWPDVACAPRWRGGGETLQKRMAHPCQSSGAAVMWRMKLPVAVVLAAAFFVQLHAEPPIASNSAIIPAGRLEKDFYDWDARHASVMEIKDMLKPEIVLIGDSITHMWG